jgi:hypothetical protein
VKIWDYIENNASCARWEFGQFHSSWIQGRSAWGRWKRWLDSKLGYCRTLNLNELARGRLCSQTATKTVAQSAHCQRSWDDLPLNSIGSSSCSNCHHYALLWWPLDHRAAPAYLDQLCTPCRLIVTRPCCCSARCWALRWLCFEVHLVSGWGDARCIFI